MAYFTFRTFSFFLKIFFICALCSGTLFCGTTQNFTYIFCLFFRHIFPVSPIFHNCFTVCNGFHGHMHMCVTAHMVQFHQSKYLNRKNNLSQKIYIFPVGQTVGV